MNQAFDPAAYDGLFSRAEALALHEYFQSDGTSPDLPAPRSRGLDRPPYQGLDLNAIVAVIVLERIQNKLPQWITRNAEGKLVFGRRTYTPSRLRKVLLAPRTLFGINWANTAPGMSWPNHYALTWVPVFDRFVVTVSADDDSMHGHTDVALGHFQSGRQFDAEAVGRIILAHWQEGSCGGRWAEFLYSGLVDEELALDWAEKIWEWQLDQEELDDPDQAGEGWWENPDDGGWYYRRLVSRGGR